jgi:hypothetical protein
MWQNIIVALIVILAAAWLAWRYLPARWRRRAGQLHPALAPREGGGCGSCSACGGCRDKGAPP